MFFAKTIIWSSNYFKINVFSIYLFFWIKICFYFCIFWAFFTITLYKFFNKLSLLECIIHFTQEFIEIKIFFKESFMNLCYFLFGKNNSTFIFLKIDYFFYYFYTVLLLIGIYIILLFAIFNRINTIYLLICIFL